MRKARHFFAKTSTLLLLAVLLPLWGVGGIAWAGPVTAEQALQLARSFIQQHDGAASRSHHAPGTNAESPSLTMAQRVSGLYVINVAADGGFVIVSNDDRTLPILGFGESGNIDPDNMPANMRAWLQGYADEIAWLRRSNITVTNAGRAKAPRRAGTHSTTAITPLLKTTWNQSEPYNNQTPYYKKESDNSYSFSATSKSGYEHCVTGCVATAMAQVMNYHQWPQTATTAIPGYNWGDIALSSLSATTFDWANMLDSYSSGYTSTQASAVAMLMQYCGWSVEMNYGESSGASSSKVATALKNYFDYNETTQYVSSMLYV